MSKLYIHIIGAVILTNGICPSFGDEISSYDRMRTVFISQLFRAVKQKDYGLALEKVDRLQELSSSSVTLSYLRHELEENIAIEKARKILHQGNYSKALKVLDDAAIGDPQQGEGLAKAYNTIKGLDLIKTYLKGLPYSGSEAMQQAFSRLPMPNLFHGTSEFYKDWYQGEKKRLETLIDYENKRLLRELLDELDVALNSSSKNQEVLVTQLLLLLNDEDNIPAPQLDALVYCFNSSDFTSISPELTNQLGMTNQSTLSGEKNRIIELILYSIYQKGNEEVKKSISASVANRTLSTISGLMLDIDNSFTKGSYFTALREFTRLFRLLHQFDGHEIYNRILNNYLNNHLMPTSPSLYSVLFHLYYVQEFE